MVSGFFGAGAADQFNKQQELDTAESRVRNQAEQFRTTNALNLLQNARDRLEKVTQLGALPQFANAPSFQGVIEGQRGNVVRAAQLAGITDENQLMAMIRTSSALGQGAVPLKAFEERQTAAGRARGAEAGSTENVQVFDEFGNVIDKKIRSDTGEDVRILGKGKKVESVLDEIPGVSKPEATAFRKTLETTDFTIGEFNNVLKQVNSPGVFIGVPGIAQRFGASMAATMKAFVTNTGGTAEIGGKPVKESDLLDPKLYDITKFSAAGQSQAFKSNMINLAYSIARSLDPAGRLSDFDVQVQLDALGTKQGDKEALTASIMDGRRRVISALKSKVNVLRTRIPDIEDELPPNLRALLQEETPPPTQPTASIPPTSLKRGQTSGGLRFTRDE